MEAGGSREPAWVVRGGIATPDNLRAGYREHLGALGVFGCSVQYQPGRTLDQLAAAGRFRHGRISYAAGENLKSAAARLGYELAFAKTPGGGIITR